MPTLAALVQVPVFNGSTAAAAARESVDRPWNSSDPGSHGSGFQDHSDQSRACAV